MLLPGHVDVLSKHRPRRNHSSVTSNTCRTTCSTNAEQAETAASAEKPTPNMLGQTSPVALS